MKFNDKNIFPETIVNSNNEKINDEGIICPVNTIFNQVGFKSFESFIMSLNLDIDTLKRLNNTFKDKKVFKIILTPIILEKLNLERLFFKNDLNTFNDVEYKFNTFERFFNLNNLYHDINYNKSNFLLDSVVILKRQLTKDGLINVLFVNKVVLRQIKKLLKNNKLYGIKDRDKKGLYNVFQHSDKNKHYLLSVDNINFKVINYKNNLNYSVLEQMENYYINLDDLKTHEKIKLIDIIRNKEKQNKIDYINNLTYNNIKTFYKDYENFNYKSLYKGLKLKDIKIKTDNKKDYLSYYHEYLRHLKRLYL